MQYCAANCHSSLLAVLGFINITSNIDRTGAQVKELTSAFNLACKEESTSLPSLQDKEDTLERRYQDAKSKREKLESKLKAQQQSEEAAKRAWEQAKDARAKKKDAIEVEAANSNRLSHIKQVAVLFHAFLTLISDLHKNENDRGRLPLAQMQHPLDIGIAYDFMDYEAIKALTVLQCIGFTRALYFFGYLYSSAHLESWGRNDQQVGLLTSHDKIAVCHETVCKICGVEYIPQKKRGRGRPNKSEEEARAKKKAKNDQLLRESILSRLNFKASKEEKQYGNEHAQDQNEFVKYLVYRHRQGLLGTTTDCDQGFNDDGRFSPPGDDSKPAATQDTSRRTGS